MEGQFNSPNEFCRHKKWPIHSEYIFIQFTLIFYRLRTDDTRHTSNFLKLKQCTYIDLISIIQTLIRMVVLILWTVFEIKRSKKCVHRRAATNIRLALFMIYTPFHVHQKIYNIQYYSTNQPKWNLTNETRQDKTRRQRNYTKTTRNQKRKLKNLNRPNMKTWSRHSYIRTDATIFKHFRTQDNCIFDCNRAICIYFENILLIIVALYGPMVSFTPFSMTNRSVSIQNNLFHQKKKINILIYDKNKTYGNHAVCWPISKSIYLFIEMQDDFDDYLNITQLKVVNDWSKFHNLEKLTL